jgi:hypothetical protein
MRPAANRNADNDALAGLFCSASWLGPRGRLTKFVGEVRRQPRVTLSNQAYANIGRLRGALGYGAVSPRISTWIIARSNRAAGGAQSTVGCENYS